MTNSTDLPYLSILMLLLGGVGFAVAPLGLAWLWAARFSRNKPGLTKNQVYECGLESTGDGWTQFKPAYYLYALVFLIFDVEAVFLLPFAVAFGHFSASECIEMAIFLLLLVEGLVWACRKNVLTWT
jgi:NADH-quinone oxidoreductase subunit A